MTVPTPRDEQLEALVNRAFQDLPAIRAPATLERRVVAELQRRAAQPAWQRGFAHWTRSTRFAFVSLCCALIALMVTAGAGTFTVPSLVADLAAHAVSRAQPTMMAAEFVLAMASSLGNMIPSAWLYIGLGVGAMLYAILFGVGAAVYRTLYLKPLNGR